MQRIGIIGVGEIGRAIVEGLCGGGGEPPALHLSPRGARTAAELAERYGTVRVCADNQEVADRSDLLILAVRPGDRHEALAGLRIGAETTVVNLMAGVANEELRGLVGAAPLVRAIPLPTVRERRSVTVVFPSRPDTDALFDRLGGAQPVADEAAFDLFSALTGTLTAHYRYLGVLASWAVDRGVDPEVADRYLRSLFEGVGRSLGDPDRALDRLAADHETPRGNNEFIRTTWFGPANEAALRGALDALLDRLRGGRPGA